MDPMDADIKKEPGAVIPVQVDEGPSGWTIFSIFLNVILIIAVAVMAMRMSMNDRGKDQIILVDGEYYHTDGPVYISGNSISFSDEHGNHYIIQYDEFEIID